MKISFNFHWQNFSKFNIFYILSLKLTKITFIKLYSLSTFQKYLEHSRCLNFIKKKFFLILLHFQWQNLTDTFLPWYPEDTWWVLLCTGKKKWWKFYFKKPFGTLHKVMPLGVGCSQNNKHPSEAELKGGPRVGHLFWEGTPLLSSGCYPYT